MKKIGAIILALITLEPILYLILFFTFIIKTFMSFGNNLDLDKEPGIVQILFPLHFLTMLILFGLLIFYVVNVFRNALIESDKKVLWLIVIFFGNIIAMPVYWYIHIWKPLLEKS